MKEKTKCETKKLLKIKGKLSLEGKAPVTKKKKKKKKHVFSSIFTLLFTIHWEQSRYASCTKKALQIIIKPPSFPYAHKCSLWSAIICVVNIYCNSLPVVFLNDDLNENWVVYLADKHQILVQKNSLCAHQCGLNLCLQTIFLCVFGSVNQISVFVCIGVTNLNSMRKF